MLVYCPEPNQPPFPATLVSSGGLNCSLEEWVDKRMEYYRSSYARVQIVRR